MVHDAPAASACAVQLLVSVKSREPLPAWMTILLMVNGVVPVFFTVIGCGALFVPDC
jgi:hypothetical protein